MEEKLEALTHYSMSVIGGFFGGFAVWNFMATLGNAQTANMIEMVTDIVGGNFLELMERAVGFFIYLLGFALSVALKRIDKINIKYFSVIFDTIAILILAIFPHKNENIVISLYPIFFAMSFQWSVFSGAYGYSSSSIFSTNNLRQFSTAVFEYLFNKDKSYIKKASFYGKTLLSYHFGVFLACIASVYLGILGVLLGLLPIAISAFLIVKDSDFKVNKNVDIDLKAFEKY